MCVWLVLAGDMKSLSSDTKQELCQALEEQTGGWESLAQALGLGILTSAFRLSSCPAGKLLDSYEVSSFTDFFTTNYFCMNLKLAPENKKVCYVMFKSPELKELV